MNLKGNLTQSEHKMKEKKKQTRREEEAYEARSVINQLYWSLPT